jgi:general secretion pathway protein F
VRLAAAAGKARDAAEAKGGEKRGGGGLFRPRFGSRALALVTRQLATLITVAPLEESLRTIAMQAENAAVRRVLLATHAQVLEGFRLSDAMARQGDSFPPLYRAMVAAGESSGALPSILERLADLLEKQQETRAKVTAALVYPTLLAVTALGVVIALMTFVVPRVVEQFDGVGQELPLLTQVVMAISSGVRTYGLFAAIALAVGAFLFLRAMRAQAFRLRVDRAVLRAPLIGRLVRDLHAARLARTLSTMLASGLPVLESLVISARTIPNEVIRRATGEMAEAVREGGSLSSAMRRAAVFPPILVYLSASGEESSRLDVMLGRAADYLDREFNTFMSVALSLLEPAIIVIMGVVVAAIVLSILLPILQLNTLALG